MKLLNGGKLTIEGEYERLKTFEEKYKDIEEKYKSIYDCMVALVLGSLALFGRHEWAYHDVKKCLTYVVGRWILFPVVTVLFVVDLFVNSPLNILSWFALMFLWFYLIIFSIVILSLVIRIFIAYKRKDDVFMLSKTLDKIINDESEKKHVIELKSFFVLTMILLFMHQSYVTLISCLAITVFLSIILHTVQVFIAVNRQQVEN